MEDITPGLLKQIENDFNYGISQNKTIKKLIEKVKDGTATYAEGNEYAIAIGEELAKAYKLNLYSSALPDGKMYYNIASRILTPTLTNNYNNISEVAAQIQLAINQSAGIGLKAVVPKLNTDRMLGLINRISSENKFDDVAWILDEPVVNFSQSIIDDFIRDNSEFQGKSGIGHKLVRTVAGGCCDWCQELAGSYNYMDAPKDIYRRHDRCRCTVEYIIDRKQVDLVHSGTEGKRKYIRNKYGGYELTKEARIERARVMKLTEAERKAAARQKRIDTWAKKR